MTLYNNKRFTVPATNAQRKTPCAVHHFVKGQCLRCPEKMVKIIDAPGNLDVPSIGGIEKWNQSNARFNVPTDAEGDE